MKLDRGLVSPVRETPPVLHFANRPSRNATISVLLIDGMLNPKARWGQNLLDGVEDALSGRGRRFERVARRPGGASFPDSWAKSHIGRTHLAITAVGD